MGARIASGTYKGTGFAPHVELRVTVRQQAVTHTTAVSPDRAAGIAGHPIETLLQDVKRRLDSDCDVSVAYDDALGYPASVSSDCGQEDDGWKHSRSGSGSNKPRRIWICDTGGDTWAFVGRTKTGAEAMKQDGFTRPLSRPEPGSHLWTSAG